MPGVLIAELSSRGGEGMDFFGSKRGMVLVASALLLSGCFDGFKSSSPVKNTSSSLPSPTPSPTPTPTPAPTPGPTPTPTGMHVAMGAGGAPGQIVDSQGHAVKFHGVNKMGSEYACVQGSGIFDGPTDQDSVNAMITWKVNVVRIPLNEDCWLAINGVNSAYAGSNYQAAIANYVQLLNSNGIMAILELHWSAPGTQLANRQLAMADFDHSPTFWGEVASAFAGNDMVIFDLFNEPYITDWSCWAHGGFCAQDANGNSYNVAGMESLLSAVRGAGAENLVLLGGLAYANDFSNWVGSVNSINNSLTGNVAASWHQYDFNFSSGCPSSGNGYYSLFTCLSGAQTASNAHINIVLAAGFPVVLGETGISAFSSSTGAPFTATQIQSLMNWQENLLAFMDQQGQGYLGWSWNTDAVPSLISDSSSYAPSSYFGVTYKNHLSVF